MRESYKDHIGWEVAIVGDTFMDKVIDRLQDRVLGGLKAHLGDNSGHHDCDHCPYGPMAGNCDALLIKDALSIVQAYKDKDAFMKKELRTYGANLRRVYTGKA